MCMCAEWRCCDNISLKLMLLTRRLLDERRCFRLGGAHCGGRVVILFYFPSCTVMWTGLYRHYRQFIVSCLVCVDRRLCLSMSVRRGDRPRRPAAGWLVFDRFVRGWCLALRMRLTVLQSTFVRSILTTVVNGRVCPVYSVRRKWYGGSRQKCLCELNRVVNCRKQRRLCYNEQLVNAVEVHCTVDSEAGCLLLSWRTTVVRQSLAKWKAKWFVDCITVCAGSLWSLAQRS